MNSTERVSELWDFDDPAGSAERFAVAAQSAEEPLRSVLLTQQARALGLQGQFEQGHDLLDQVSSSDTEVSVRRALERGRLFRSAGDADAAAPQFSIAARQTRDQLDRPVLGGLHVDALHMLALLPTDPNEQIELTQAALEVSRRAASVEARNWAGSLLNNLGSAYYDAGDLESAQASFAEALTECERRGDPSRTEFARAQLDWIDGELAGGARGA